MTDNTGKHQPRMSPQAALWHNTR
ncbi:hypothetical protein LSH36_601g01088 [Paralvinella palmiformis]|uniref:Uncharacterized protein n=1 Tax=Paralvinella palmiformis TaxID=53620 RepID=A0AAD9MXF2_9ANNE|nr:hypothetical protein LSH36_601g01088 [Paralvinella palmiformis]